MASQDTEELWVLEGASTWNQEPKVQILDLLRLGARPVSRDSSHCLCHTPRACPGCLLGKMVGREQEFYGG